MFDPKKLQQVADDLGEPRKQIVLEALELLNFYMGRTAELFLDLERAKKVANTQTSKLDATIAELNQANEERDAAVEELESVKRARDHIVTSSQKRTAERDFAIERVKHLEGLVLAVQLGQQPKEFDDSKTMKQYIAEHDIKVIADVFKQARNYHRDSDMRVTLVFPSCRTASEFEECLRSVFAMRVKDGE